MKEEMYYDLHPGAEKEGPAGQGRKDEMSVYVLLNAYAVNVESFCAFAGWALYWMVWCLVGLLAFSLVAAVC